MTQPLTADFFASVRPSLFGGAISQAQVDALNAINRSWEKYGDGDVRKQAYVFATPYHEVGSGLIPRSENLNYRAARIREVWPSRFKTAAEAAEYASNPQKLANKVYGGRLGNTQPNDGWTYRGRGYSQITGRENYAKFGALLGIDLVGKPDLALEPENAAAILVLGVVRGLFTGRKLADGVPDWIVARATVNADGAANGKKIGLYADKFQAALKAGAAAPVVKPSTPTPTPSTAPAASQKPRSPVALLVTLVIAAVGGVYAFLKSQGWVP